MVTYMFSKNQLMLHDLENAAFSWRADCSLETEEEVPDELQHMINDNLKEGLPTMVGKHEVYGWYLLVSAGQGPVLGYMEHLDLIEPVGA